MSESVAVNAIMDPRTENRFSDLVMFGCVHLCKARLSINESKTTTTTASSPVSYHFFHLNIITCLGWNWYTLREGQKHEEEQKVVDAGQD